MQLLKSVFSRHEQFPSPSPHAPPWQQQQLPESTALAMHSQPVDSRGTHATLTIRDDARIVCFGRQLVSFEIFLAIKEDYATLRCRALLAHELCRFLVGETPSRSKRRREVRPCAELF